MAEHGSIPRRALHEGDDAAFALRLRRACTGRDGPEVDATRLRAAILLVRAAGPDAAAPELAALGRAAGSALPDALGAVHRRDLPAAIAHLEAAAECLEPSVLRDEVDQLRMLMLANVGRYPEALAAGEALEPRIARAGPELRGRYWNNRAKVALDVDRPELAVDWARRSIALRETHDERWHLASSYSNLALALRLLGALDEAREANQRSIALAREAAGHPQLALYLEHAAELHLLLGDLEAARAALRDARSLGPPRAHHWLVTGRVAAGAGDPAGALEALTRHAEAAGERVAHEALPELADAWLDAGEPDRALELLDRFERGGTWPAAAARAAIVRARCLSGAGEHGRARAQLARAEPTSGTHTHVERAYLDARLELAAAAGDLAEENAALRAQLAFRERCRRQVSEAQLAASRAEHEIWQERRRAEAAEAAQRRTEAAYRHLHEVVEARQESLRMVVHDLRNPLTAMVAMADLLHRSLRDEGPPQLAEDAATLVEASQRVTAGIDSLLLRETAEHREPLWEPDGVDLSEVVRQAARAHRAAAEAKGQDLHLATAPALPRARADLRMVVEIVDNLLSNAVKFSPPGARIVLGTSTSGRGPVAWVHDGGPGFGAGDLDRAFEPFRRLSARPTAGEPSTGLGLYIARVLTERLGGELTVQHPDGGGARVGLCLAPA